MKKGVLPLSVFALSSWTAFAETMSCAVGVYKASDVMKEESKAEEAIAIVRVPLDDSGGEIEADEWRKSRVKFESS